MCRLKDASIINLLKYVIMFMCECVGTHTWVQVRVNVRSQSCWSRNYKHKSAVKIASTSVGAERCVLLAAEPRFQSQKIQFWLSTGI